jgi:hypothetical protein
VEGQDDGKNTAFAQLALDVDAAAVLADDLVDDAEADAGAGDATGFGAAGAVEAVKDALEVVGIHAHAAVADGDVEF